MNAIRRKHWGSIGHELKGEKEGSKERAWQPDWQGKGQEEDKDRRWQTVTKKLDVRDGKQLSEIARDSRKWKENAPS